mgnify:CR=1 FL=1|jgi:hypothetical protein
MTEKSEWQFLVDYVKDDTTDFYNDACQNQLVALWTSYCLHNSLDVDTAMYDAVLMDLFNALSEQSWTNPNYFPLLQQQSRHPQSGWFENHPCS